MSPRPYKVGVRQAATDRTRGRIMEAAREVLADNGFAGFTIEQIARRADVARMTVYYQFASKTGLMEGLFDDLAGRGLVERLRASFGQGEPFEALGEFIGAFVGFWASDRIVIRRLRSLAAIDPKVDAGVRARDARRRDGLRVLVGRLADRDGHPKPGAIDEAIDVLHMLTSFETFDALAGTSRSPEDVATLLIRLAHGVVNLDSA